MRNKPDIEARPAFCHTAREVCAVDGVVIENHHVAGFVLWASPLPTPEMLRPEEWASLGLDQPVPFLANELKSGGVTSARAKSDPCCEPIEIENSVLMDTSIVGTIGPRGLVPCVAVVKTSEREAVQLGEDGLRNLAQRCFFCGADEVRIENIASHRRFDTANEGRFRGFGGRHRDRENISVRVLGVVRKDVRRALKVRSQTAVNLDCQLAIQKPAQEDHAAFVKFVGEVHSQESLFVKEGGRP